MCNKNVWPIVSNCVIETNLSVSKQQAHPIDFWSNMTSSTGDGAAKRPFGAWNCLSTSYRYLYTAVTAASDAPTRPDQRPGGTGRHRAHVKSLFSLVFFLSQRRASKIVWAVCSSKRLGTGQNHRSHRDSKRVLGFLFPQFFTGC